MQQKTPPKQGCNVNGADDGVRTRDPDLGKVVLYQLSHVRVARKYNKGCQSILQAPILTFFWEPADAR